MMQILNNAFRHKSLEKWDRKWGQATFLTHSKEIFYLAYKRKGKSDITLFEKSSLSPFYFLNGKERATGPSLKKGVCPVFCVFSPVVPRAYSLLDLTKTRGWHNINLIFTNI